MTLLQEYLIFLAQANITLFGFVAIFFIFRYKSLDAYIDNRYATLRDIFHAALEHHPHLELLLLALGSNRPTDVQELLEHAPHPETVRFFIHDISRLYQWRSALKGRAMWTLFYLACLTIAILCVLLFSGLLAYDPLLDSLTRAVMALCFTIGLGATLNLLYKSFGQSFSKKGFGSSRSI
ncbi:MAG: hypothetical protein KDK39_13295 [Leptospiraceae bacterium]|nr:hypothetical protein [Leptospiraceae bacterium]